MTHYVGESFESSTCLYQDYNWGVTVSSEKLRPLRPLLCMHEVTLHMAGATLWPTNTWTSWLTRMETVTALCMNIITSGCLLDKLRIISSTDMVAPGGPVDAASDFTLTVLSFTRAAITAGMCVAEPVLVAVKQAEFSVGVAAAPSPDHCAS